MTGHEVRAVEQLRRLASAQDDDAALLSRFLKQADATAFAELVHRHGPMVLGVCHRVLGRGQDADDAFQAAFVVLARKCDTLRDQRSVGGFLFGVARFAALRARDKERRRREHEAKAVREARTPTTTDHELLAAVDEELQRLPTRYRVPLVACFLQGRTQEEAARETGCSLSTLRRRLERGQQLLRERLTGRGIAPALGALGAAAVTAPVSATLVESTTLVVMKAVIGNAGTAPVAVLAEGVMTMMARTKLKALAATALVVAVLAGGTIAWAVAATEPPKPIPDMVPPGTKAPAKPPEPPAKADLKKNDPAADKINPGDRFTIRGTNVFDRAPLDQIFEIGAGGEIDLGEIYGGKVKIGGLTLNEAEAVILKQLKIYLHAPEIKLSRFTPAPPLELEQRVRQLEKEVKELRSFVGELQNKKP